MTKPTQARKARSSRNARTPAKAGPARVLGEADQVAGRTQTTSSVHELVLADLLGRQAAGAQTKAETMRQLQALIDGAAQVTKALARLLREHGLQTVVFNSAEDVVAWQAPSVPGCLVLGLAMPGLDGLALQRLMAELGRPWPIVFLTGNGDIPSSVKAMKAGAVDFLSKPVSAQTLLAAMQAGLAQDALARQAREQDDALAARHEQLTRREREVLDCLAHGKLNKQIAAELGIVEPTVKFHRARIMERMGARTLAELMLLAARLGLPAARAEPAPVRGHYPKG